ncbi:MAG: hypothetical protein H5U16_11420 [Roseovarius sp.]|nr:hypothetical protein [Roseovarius sp.]
MKLLDLALHRRLLRDWRKAAQSAPTMTMGELRRMRARGRELGYFLGEALAVAENRLALPVIGSATFPRPHGTDWAWRPQIWRQPLLPAPGMASIPSGTGFGPEVKVFHDCPRCQLTLRQLRNSRATDLAPYDLRLDVLAFEGSFLSVVVDLPDAATDGLTRQHLIRLDTAVEIEAPLTIYARLNIRHGPNTEQIVQQLPLDAAEIMVEFDLAFSPINEKRIERAWIDLIFETPQMNQVTLRDVTLSRRLRAAV